MKIAFTIVLVFIGVIITENIILPSLLHIYGSFLAFGFLAALFLVYSNSPSTLVFAITAAFILELWNGWDLGSTIISALAAGGIWQWVSGFFNVEPLIHNHRFDITSIVPMALIGYILVTIMNVCFLIIEKYVYGTDVAWGSLKLSVASPTVWLTVGLGIIVCLLLLRLPGRQSMPAEGKFYV